MISSRTPKRAARASAFDLARAAFSRGDIAATERLCLESLACNRDDSRPWALLAETALRRGRPDAAIVCADKSVALNARDPMTHLMRAKSLAQIGRLAEAEAAAETGVALADGAALLLDGFGAIFSAIGRQRRALPLFLAAVAASPGNPQYLYNLAATERMLGLLDDAERHCDQAIACDPGFSLAYYLRADLREQTVSRNHVAELERVLAQSPHPVHPLTPQGEILLRFALGKECDDIGDTARAFAHFKAGAELQRRPGPAETGGYAVRDDVEAVERIMRLQTLEALRSLPAGFDGDDPIFVVGLPRSGTTLVERIVASHSGVVSAGELGAFPTALERAAGTGARGLAGLDPAALGRAYSHAARQRSDLDGRRFIDKYPGNYLNCGAIHAALPRAKIIAVRRNPMDSCFALYRAHFAGTYPFSYDLKELAEYYAVFDRLIAHWRAVLPEVIFLEVAYERIVADTVGQSRRILGFLGLPWEDGVLRFNESGAPAATASAVQVRRPVYASSVGKWRRHETQLEPLRSRLRELLLLEDLS